MRCEVCFFLLVLKLAPYNSILDDYIISFTAAGTCIVTFVGLLLLMDENREVKLFNSGALGGFLAAITILIMCCNLFGISMKFFVVKYFFGESTQNRSFL